MKPSSSDHHRRKRKQQRILLRQSFLLLSVRSLVVLCFTILTFLYLLSHTNNNPFTSSSSSSFRPVLVLSSLSLLSSSSSSSSLTTANNKSVQDFSNYYNNSVSPLKLENRVLFPDHVLLLLSGGNNIKNELECVYFSNNSLSVQKMLSVDEYDDHQFRSIIIIRCPIPMSVNYSADDANLRWAGNKNMIFLGGLMNKNKTYCSWENVVYEAALDGGTVVVFVKGLNLRADRLSDHRQFSCHFGLGGKSDKMINESYVFRTMALTAAQEVVRCPLPRGVLRNADKVQGIRVTVGWRHNFRAGSEKLVLMPSVVAKVFDQMSERNRTGEKKSELCVCTMVWNQASAIREWIMYHSWLGVERWFVYDNNSDDRIDEVIQELDLENYNVTRHVWPWIKTQEAGFSHCALRAKHECNWVSFMDVDEYFYFPYSTTHRHKRFRNLGHAGRNSLRALVVNFSSVSRNVGEIRTSCHSFGPSGRNSRPPSQGVMVGYTCRLHSPERHKSIIRPDALDSSLLNVVHHFRLKKGFKYLNMPKSTAIINHYKYQVWEVFRAKFYRRVATYVADWHENHNEGSRDRAPGLGTEAVEPFDWPQRFCEVWDTGLRDFVLSNLVDVSTGLLPWETSKYGFSDQL